MNTGLVGAAEKR